MTMQRNVHVRFRAVAVVLIGIASVTPSLARSDHGRTHFRFHHGAHLGKTVSPAVSTDRHDQDHPISQVSGNKPVNQPGAKTPIPPVNSGDSTAPSNQPVTIGRGGRQNSDDGHHQGDHFKGATDGASASSGHASDFHMKDLGPVDTRITVEPPEHVGRNDKNRHQANKFRLVAPEERHAFGHPVVKKFERNAIGLAVPVHIAKVTQDGSHFDVPPAKTNPAMPGPTVRIYQNTDRSGFHPSAGPVGPTAVVARQAISGTGLVRRGFVPAAIGGPAKVVGISGSMFRPRH